MEKIPQTERWEQPLAVISGVGPPPGESAREQRRDVACPARVAGTGQRAGAWRAESLTRVNQVNLEVKPSAR